MEEITLKDTPEICPNCKSDRIYGKFESNDKKQFIYIEYCMVCEKETYREN